MNAGQSNMAAVSQTEANYYSICTQITDLKQQISDLENEFSALLGEAPQKYAIGSMNNWKVPARMSAGIPAAALANRPDVKQAETQLAVAYYATNESRAAFYPGLNLSGAIGWTNDLGTLPVNPGKWIWNAMASLTQPIFQNGKLRAQYKISKAQQEQAKLSFQQQTDRFFGNGCKKHASIDDELVDQLPAGVDSPTDFADGTDVANQQ